MKEDWFSSECLKQFFEDIEPFSDFVGFGRLNT
uniref:Uncharacterized protein n=1 Tax=Rhizophora mucronata TaxID=61149 RepID=A0A2P2NC67_RHIMU